MTAESILLSIITCCSVFLFIAVLLIITGNLKIRIKRQKLDDLLKHRLFSSIKYHLTNNIPCVTVGSIEKSILFRNMLKIKYNVVRVIAIKMVSELTSKGFLDDEEFLKWNIRLITEMVIIYEKEWILHGISKKMIDTFNQWHSHRVDVLIYEIESIAKSKSHESYHEKEMIIFDLIKYILDMTIYDVERTLLKLDVENGFTSVGNINGKT